MKLLALLLPLALACAACDTGYESTEDATGNPPGSTELSPDAAEEPPDSAVDAPDTGGPAPPALLPLEIGNAWVLDITRDYANGGTSHYGLDTLRVVADTLMGGETWYHLQGGHIQTQACLDGFYRFDDDGVWFWRNPSNPESQPALRYRYPADPGDSYPYPIEGADATVTVIDTSASVTTPAGTFSAYHYEVRYHTIGGTPVPEDGPPEGRFFAPGTGFVRYEKVGYYESDEGTLVLLAQQRWELVAFLKG